MLAGQQSALPLALGHPRGAGECNTVPTPYRAGGDPLTNGGDEMQGLRVLIGLVCLVGLAGCMEFDRSLMDTEAETAPAGSVGKAATAKEIVARVSGGGRAVVTNEEGFLPPGAVTEFGVNARIDDSGEAMGQVSCFVEPGAGGFTADITGGEDLGDSCVLLTGTSTCVFPGFGVFFDEPVTLTVCTGGPDEGGFTVCFANFEEFCCDEETVINGVINEHTVSPENGMSGLGGVLACPAVLSVPRAENKPSVAFRSEAEFDDCEGFCDRLVCQLAGRPLTRETENAGAKERAKRRAGARGPRTHIFACSAIRPLPKVLADTHDTTSNPGRSPARGFA